MAWQGTLKIIAATVALTSLAWIVGTNVISIHGPLPEAAPSLAADPSSVSAHMVQPTAAQALVPAATQLASAVPPAPVAAPQLGKLVIPVQGVLTSQLVDTYTQSRAAGARQHDAIDILAPIGTPVRAAAPGRLEKLFFSKDGGNTIYIRSADRRTGYYYAHLDRYAPGLAEGQAISAGQVIGAVGASGNADPGAPHLHFAINVLDPADSWWKSAPVNPYPLLIAR
ncbi:MAG: M23 family metallopeptidase [Novosphingobium sp.]